MLLDTTRIRRHLQICDLHTLFIEELGWEHHRQELIVPVDGYDFRLCAVAHKRGLAAFRCAPAADGRIPPYPIRRKIETQVTQSVNQHLIIYADAGETQQVWQWVKRAPGQPAAAREHAFSHQQTGEALIQKLNIIAFSLEDEADLGGIVQVAERVRAGFDVERITKRFYERFKAEHADFLKFISGIPDEAAQRWYASVMLNRLMFIYFIQKKGFLDGDPDYLRTRLAASQAAGADRFYAGFLCPLFFEGFARWLEARAPATRDLLGQVPYLNGGIFDRHQIETAHGGAIRIPDAAFERLFDFFDAYHWHLDERPLRADNEINPDVLGYIFEKYINQKQMGAYYTKEDITGYISQNTIIPYLLDAARRDCRVAFEGEHSVWRLLAADPDRYIYPAMRHGAGLPLPAEIAAGLADVSKRDGWNRPAPAEYALPTEIWREVVARRQRYEEVKAKLAAGEVRQVNDLITLNLNICQFAQDVIAECEGPELLRALWRAIESVTVLDPTVGSGAFLFAALNVLEPLYEGCLERMQAFVDDHDAGRLKSLQPARSLPAQAEPESPQGDFAEVAATSSRPSPAKYADFRKLLARVAQHPNRRYFILKSIIVNNLYGVDIMEEAVEICKLRLFLKLVAQVERVEDVEPLPDIDFNIRAGNTLVGYATREDVQRALTTATDGRMKLMFEEESTALQRFEARAADVERLFGLFRQQQTELGGQVTAEDKAELRRRLDALDDELNRALAREYGVEPPGDSKSQLPTRSLPSQANGQSAQADFAKVDAVSTAVLPPTPYACWLVSHRPLHWFVEFYGIMRGGGFDVVIGNPPYVEYAKIKSDYTVRGFTTGNCGNLYAYIVERNELLLARQGYTGMIVPHSAICTDRMDLLIKVLTDSLLWVSTYDIRPAKLFVGVDQRLAVYLKRRSESRSIYCTKYHRWNEAARGVLFSLLQYAKTEDCEFKNSLAKVGYDIERSIWRRIHAQKSLVEQLRGQARLYFHNAPRYWIRAMTFVPYFWNERGGEQLSTQVKILNAPSKLDAGAIAAALNSSLFYWWFVALSDCRHLNLREIESFPLELDRMAQNIKSELGDLVAELMKDYEKYSVRKETEYQTTGRVIYDEFYPRFSKPIIDEIDRVLARHYSFTDEELDFIINYDIKYRMGDELAGGDGAADENG